MIKFVNDQNGFYVRIGLYVVSFFVIPHSKRAVPHRRFGHISFGSCFSYGYKGKHGEFWLGRTYYGFDIDHYESREALQGYFNVDMF